MCLDVYVWLRVCLCVSVQDGWTAAMLARVYGNEACLKLLIEAGAKLDEKENRVRDCYVFCFFEGEDGWVWVCEVRGTEDQ